MILNNDEETCLKLLKPAEKHELVTFGIKNRSDYMASEINIEFNKTISGYSLLEHMS